MGVLKVKDAQGNWVPIGVGVPNITAWTALTLTAPWTNLGSGYQNAQYRMNDDVVEIRGVITGGVLGSTIATLPVGFRPPAKINISTNVGFASPSMAVLDISASGAIVLTIAPGATGNAGYLNIIACFSVLA